MAMARSQDRRKTDRRIEDQRWRRLYINLAIGFTLLVLGILSLAWGLREQGRTAREAVAQESRDAALLVCRSENTSREALREYFTEQAERGKEVVRELGLFDEPGQFETYEDEVDKSLDRVKKKFGSVPCMKITNGSTNEE